MRKTRTNNRGQSLLALVILIGAILVTIGATIIFSVSAYMGSANALQNANLAEAAAAGGAEDGLLQLDRNSTFSSGGYSLPVGSTTATVSVAQNTPSTNLVTILSQATVSGSTRKINVVVAKNASTSQLTVTLWQETQ